MTNENIKQLLQGSKEDCLLAMHFLIEKVEYFAGEIESLEWNEYPCKFHRMALLDVSRGVGVWTGYGVIYKISNNTLEGRKDWYVLTKGNSYETYFI